MKYERFEDVPVWQDGIGLARNVFVFTEHEAFRRKGDDANQLQRAALSVPNNISEGFERGTTQELITFLYYARGSLFETKYWLNRSEARDLMPSSQAQSYASQLSDLARQLNSFASGLKDQRKSSRKQPKKLRETPAEYVIDSSDDATAPIFTTEELEWLKTIPNP